MTKNREPLQMPKALEMIDDGGHLIVWRRDGKSGIPWETLQALKSQVWGPDARAVEVYPAESNVMYEQNARHLFRVPDELHVPDLRGNCTWDKRFN